MPSYESNSGQSEELQEIIGYVPRWITRWGISIVAVVFAVVILVTNFIQFPESITAELVITPREPPFALSWYQNDFNVTYSLKVKHSQFVKAGDTLLLESNAKDSTVTAVTSPVAGKVHLSWGRDNNPKAQLLAVVPEIAQFEGQVMLTEQGRGKVKVGQKVLIQLDAYPRSEFGLLEGNIKNIFPVQFDKKYRATVALPEKLVTNTGKVIPTQAQLDGSAEIITDNKKLIRRIFASLF
jgi:hypothetical protein